MTTRQCRITTTGGSVVTICHIVNKQPCKRKFTIAVTRHLHIANNWYQYSATSSQREMSIVVRIHHRAIQSKPRYSVDCVYNRDVQGHTFLWFFNNVPYMCRRAKGLKWLVSGFGITFLSNEWGIVILSIYSSWDHIAVIQGGVLGRNGDR